MTRLSLQVPTSVHRRMKRLRKLSHASSVSEVIRRAVGLYEVLLEADAEGSKVILERDGKRQQLVVRC